MPTPLVANRWSRILRALTGMVVVYCGILTAAGLVSVSLFFESANWLPDQIPQLFIVMYMHGAALLGFALIWLATGRVNIKSAKVPKLVLVLLPFLFLLSVDRIVGVFYPAKEDFESFFTPHAKRGWTLLPAASVRGAPPCSLVRTNAIGLRGPNISPRKPASERRIAFLGDSIAFGYTVEDDETLSAQAESLLAVRKSAGVQCRCINLGVPKYTTWQEVDLLNEVVDIVKPDLVFLQFCINDVYDLSGTREGQVRYRPIATTSTGSANWSGIYRAFNKIITDRHNKGWHDWSLWGTPGGELDPSDDRFDLRSSYAEKLRPEMAELWNRTYDDLLKLRDDCRKRDIELVVLYIPNLTQLTDPPSAPQPQRRLKDWCHEFGVEFLDTTPSFRQKINQGETIPYRYLADWCHPTKAGNALVAQDVVKFLGGRPR